VERAFADPANAPVEVRDVVTQRSPRQFDVVSEIIFADDPPVPAPQLRTTIIWGADDHLPGSISGLPRTPGTSLCEVGDRRGAVGL